MSGDAAADQANFKRRAANTTIRISSQPCRQRWLFVVPAAVTRSALWGGDA
jgi:hypothetical protein